MCHLWLIVEIRCGFASFPRWWWWWRWWWRWWWWSTSLNCKLCIDWWIPLRDYTLLHCWVLQLAPKHESIERLCGPLRSGPRYLVNGWEIQSLASFKHKQYKQYKKRNAKLHYPLHMFRDREAEILANARKKKWLTSPPYPIYPI